MTDVVEPAFKQRRARIGLLTLALAGLFVLAAVRLAAIVLVDGPRLVSLGRHEHSAEMQLAAVRGPIVDRNGEPLALSAETSSIYARPRTLLATSSQDGLGRLATELRLNQRELASRLANKAPFVWLARHLPPSHARAITLLGLKGVGSVSEYKRFYPESNLAAAVVGAAGMDGQGLSGVELQYDKLVGGEPVKLQFYQDALGHPILDSPLQLRDAKVGARLELTIDSSIQAEAENYLAEQVKQSHARQGTVVIVDPFTGEVLTLANVDTQASGKGDRLHDIAVQDAFEPGSTIKGLLGAIALQDQVTDTLQQIYCEEGQWQVGGSTIHDDSRYGWLSLGGVIEVSSNIGAAKLALALGPQRYYRGLAAFGLGRKTAIDLPGEASGLLWPASRWHEIDLANHGFGQGLAVTPIQLVTAYAAIANGGVVMRPYVVKAAYDADGREVLHRTPQILRRAVSPSVAHTMNQMLQGVVYGRDGTAHRARVIDFTVAGKTGTAQIVDPATGTYYPDRLVASFVGFVPAEDPKLVILVVLYDVPRGDFGGSVAAPVFSEIAAGALERMAVAPVSTPVEQADLLPLGNALRVFASPGDKRDGLLAPAAENRESGFAAQDTADTAVNELTQHQQNIPDFRGLSLRSALALARSHHLAVEVKGEGYVVSQELRSRMVEADQSPNLEDSRTVQLVLAAPGHGVADAALAKEDYPGQVHLPHATAFSLAARRSRYGHAKIVSSSQPKRTPKHRCRDAALTEVGCTTHETS